MSYTKGRKPISYTKMPFCKQNAFKKRQNASIIAQNHLSALKLSKMPQISLKYIEMPVKLLKLSSNVYIFVVFVSVFPNFTQKIHIFKSHVTVFRLG